MIWTSWADPLPSWADHLGTFQRFANYLNLLEFVFNLENYLNLLGFFVLDFGLPIFTVIEEKIWEKNIFKEQQKMEEKFFESERLEFLSKICKKWRLNSNFFQFFSDIFPSYFSVQVWISGAHRIILHSTPLPSEYLNISDTVNFFFY